MQKEKSAWLRFYEELNDFLPPERSRVSFRYDFTGSPSIKHVIESLGVPHTEVDLILVNGKGEGFSYQLGDGDRVAVYPVFETFDITGVTRLAERPLRNPRFVLDVHLGKLAKILRLLGFDSLYENNYNDRDIAEIAENDPGRIVLTRDRGLLKRKTVTHGYWIRSIHAEDQVKEVLERFQLFSGINPFSICLVCNGKVEEVIRSDILSRLPGRIPEYYEEFTMCSRCGRIYWPGSHYEKMEKFIERIRELEN